MTYKNILLGLILFATICLAAWTTLLSLKPRTTIIPKSLKTRPDAMMQDVEAIIMDKFGKPKMKIATPKLVHYDNNSTDFIKPELTLYRKSPEPWFVSSKFARATEGIDTVNFYEEVKIQHASDGKSPATVINTAQLTVHTDDETAETKDPIMLTQPNVKVEAIGMYADINSGDIKLLSRARGEYVPNN